MRNLTVRRWKTFIGCLGKVKLYIEDIDGETEINGVKCKLLGKLKNGESATFEIDNESRKLFAIYGRFSKGFCNDFYKIPAGVDDIEITGKANFSLTMGNPFLFDQTPDDEVLANRENNRKRSKLIMIPVIIVCAVAGAFLGYYLSSLMF